MSICINIGEGLCPESQGCDTECGFGCNLNYGVGDKCDLEILGQNYGFMSIYELESVC